MEVAVILSIILIGRTEALVNAVSAQLRPPLKQAEWNAHCLPSSLYLHYCYVTFHLGYTVHKQGRGTLLFDVYDESSTEEKVGRNPK